MMLARVRHLKKGDLVIARSGAASGKTGKVLEVKQSRGLVRVDGIGVVKRHTKPSQKSPKGGIIESNRWMPASIFQVCSDSGNPLGRAGFEVAKDGDKKRVFRKGKTSSKKGK
jgi:large subunit ribosomal protein L24